MQNISKVTIDLSGKVALVTGGTRGIGKAIVDRLLEAGADVIATGTKQNDIDQLNESNQQDRLTYHQVDFSDRNSTNQFLEFIVSLPQIDILVNNAGINKIAANVDTTIETFEQMVKINLKAPYLVSREVGKKMMSQKSGHIVNITSIWSEVTKQGRSIYTTTKTGLAGLTKSLAIEFAEHNVLVNAVGPGFTLTDLTKQTNSDEEIIAIADKIPIKRMAQPDEIANLVLFLSSNMNTYITGQNIIIDGGYTNV